MATPALRHTRSGAATITGGAGTTTITTGPGDDTINFGSGVTTLHEGNGWNSPEILDDSDGAQGGANNTYAETSSWSNGPAGAGFDQSERVHAASGGSDTATWTFTGLDTSDCKGAQYRNIGYPPCCGVFSPRLGEGGRRGTTTRTARKDARGFPGAPATDHCLSA
jgi:hypothetical protein